MRLARARPHGGAGVGGLWRGCVARVIKRVASAVGEDAVVISQVHAYLNEVRQTGT